jgi:hypothetical protein
VVDKDLRKCNEYAGDVVVEVLRECFLEGFSDVENDELE